MFEQKISQEDFVKAVAKAAKEGKGAADIAEATGLAEGTVVTKMAKLRKQGVNLPALKRKVGSGRRVTDVSKLNDLISSLG